MLTITQFADAVGIKRTDPDNWRKRAGLRTDYKATVAGRAQEYTRTNVLELAAIARFMKLGFPLPKSVALADMIVRNDAAGNLRDWLLFPADSSSSGISTDNPSTEALEGLAGESPIGAVVSVNLRKMVENVDNLFVRSV